MFPATRDAADQASKDLASHRTLWPWVLERMNRLPWTASSDERSDDRELACPQCGKAILVPTYRPLGVLEKPRRAPMDSLQGTCDSCGHPIWMVYIKGRLLGAYDASVYSTHGLLRRAASQDAAGRA